MPTPDIILKKVEQFRVNLDQYKDPHYKETPVRIDFINPLFEALDWDVTNRSGLPEHQREVVHEYALGPQAPDYCFRIGRKRKFFVEAKKPSVDLAASQTSAYQLRHYAWNAHLPLSILTDFEEFSVYDCRVRPKPVDRPDTARLLYFNFEQYPEKWDTLADLFNRFAVRDGSLDQFIKESKERRDTITVDDVFLKDLESWRELIARGLALRNPELTQKELNFAVQRTIDRIVFLRIAEDRGIEPKDQLKKISEADDVYTRLGHLFHQADQKYNSGLFHFRQEKKRETTPDAWTLNLSLDDKVLKDILSRLYFPKSPYEFSVMPADILGHVYERFLGSVIRLTPAHRAKIEPKPEVRKAGGVFYTPTYIVEKIVEDTVGKHLEGKTPKQVDSLRFLDMACGSGSFLLGAYHYLLEWYRDYYIEKGTKTEKKRIYEASKGGYRLTTDEKKRILLNNIYGVDIDSQAVEVTKLSLLLKVLEGENEESLKNQLELFKSRALPDLGKNIKCGNSLLDSIGMQLGIYDDETLDRLNCFEWKSEFPDIIKCGGFDALIGNPPYIRNQAMKEWAPVEVELYKERFTSGKKGNYDIYVVFVEKGLSLLNENGRLGYILPHKFMNAKYGEGLRGLLAEGKNLSHVVHFADQQVFDQATTYTCLLFLDKKPCDSVDVEMVRDLESWRSKGQSETGSVPADTMNSSEWNFVIGKGAKLFRRLSEMPVKLGDVAARIYQGLVTGADPVFICYNDKNGAFKSDATGKSYTIEPELMHPLCKGSVNLRRYKISEITKSILFPYKLVGKKALLLNPIEMESNFPFAWNYLLENRKALESRERGKWKHDRWYAFGRSQNLSEMEQTKILTPSIANGASYTLDENDFYYFVGSGGGGGGGYGITLKDNVGFSLPYLLGILNSSLLDYFHKSISTPFRGGYYAYNRQYIEGLPVRPIDLTEKIDKAHHDRIVKLVQFMLDLHKKLDSARLNEEKKRLERLVVSTDREINELVFKLYELTSEEVTIVKTN